MRLLSAPARAAPDPISVSRLDVFRLLTKGHGWNRACSRRLEVAKGALVSLQCAHAIASIESATGLAHWRMTGVKQPLSKQAIRTRDRFFSALRAISVRDRNTARTARRVEHQINEALFQIEKYASTHRQSSARSVTACQRIAVKWLELAAECAEVDTDLADVLALFSRHWLLTLVGPQRAEAWVLRAEALVRVLSLRADQRSNRDLRNVAAYDGSQPMVTLVLRGLPRGTQPVDVEVDLADGAIIGRADDCDWVLPGEVVSRQHAKLRYDRERRAFFISNVSRNGLGLDEDRVLLDGEAEVNVGTLIRIPKEGHYLILVQSIFVPTPGLSVVGLQAHGDEAVELSDVDVDIELDAEVGAEALGPDAAPDAARDDNTSRAPRADVIDMASFMLRDSGGVVAGLMEHYPFMTPAAAECVRRYIYGAPDAEQVVRALFEDVLSAAPSGTTH